MVFESRIREFQCSLTAEALNFYFSVKVVVPLNHFATLDLEDNQGYFLQISSFSDITINEQILAADSLENIGDSWHRTRVI